MNDKTSIEYDGIANMICDEDSSKKSKRRENGDEGYSDKEKRNLSVEPITGDGMGSSPI